MFHTQLSKALLKGNIKKIHANFKTIKKGEENPDTYF